MSDAQFVKPNLYCDKACDYLNEILESHPDYIQGTVEFVGGVSQQGKVVIGSSLLEITTPIETLRTMRELMLKIELEHSVQIDKILNNP